MFSILRKNVIFENVQIRRYEYTYWGSYVENPIFVHSNPLLFGPNADKCHTWQNKIDEKNKI